MSEVVLPTSGARAVTVTCWLMLISPGVKVTSTRVVCWTWTVFTSDTLS